MEETCMARNPSSTQLQWELPLQSDSGYGTVRRNESRDPATSSESTGLKTSLGQQGTRTGAGRGQKHVDLKVGLGESCYAVGIKYW